MGTPGGKIGLGVGLGLLFGVLGYIGCMALAAIERAHHYSCGETIT